MGRAKKKLASTTSKGGPRGESAEVSVVVDGKKGGIQRTRKHLADSASGLEEYFIEDILALRWSKGHREWLVRWKWYGAKDATWEPIEHLAGAEEYISRFDQEQLEKNEEAAAGVAKKQQAARDAQSAIALVREAEIEAERRRQEAQLKNKKSKRTSPWWAYFKEGVSNTTHVYCTLPSKDDPAKECGGAIARSACPSGLQSHCLYMHNEVWKQVDAKIRQEKEEKAKEAYIG
ncbi:hypothetical protein CYMTET_8039 [Cymbomonas tetramitiformis]|uniref:Chromo domain-containing protein n=1 Tax=Cymbomonas tetramitiformis TaxID=36881 RepID=A0AAE0GUE6_9CHLO|nr:hypothetical protein CYMTET_32484 [Cymbomonas tetramitiformis]KAK3284306.1 hypothetical protein CYMTET_8039 [Cymbomonas tetramitiformis]